VYNRDSSATVMTGSWDMSKKSSSCDVVQMWSVFLVGTNTRSFRILQKTAGQSNTYVLHVETTIVIKTDFVACDVLDDSSIWVPDLANSNFFQRGKDNMGLE